MRIFAVLVVLASALVLGCKSESTEEQPGTAPPAETSTMESNETNQANEKADTQSEQNKEDQATESDTGAGTGTESN